MSNIKGKDSKIEVYTRKWFFRRGFRFRKNCKDLSGKPDIVFPKYNSIVFVNGCFWHSHADCKEGRLPKSRIEFWKEKLGKNVQRDSKNNQSLKEDGWHVFTVWECQMKENPDQILSKIEFQMLQN